MKIFVIGSNRHLNGPEAAKYNLACNELGKIIAQEGHTLLCCSNSIHTADYHILEGIKSIDGHHKIEYYIPGFKENEQSYLDILTRIQETKSSRRTFRLNVNRSIGDWRVTHLNAIKNSDIVISIGGSIRGTYTSIFSSEVLETPIALIPTFKGSSGDVWEYFKGKYYTAQEANWFSNFNITNDKVEWYRDFMRGLETLKKRNPFKVRSNKNTIIAAIICLICICSWVMLFLKGITYMGPQLTSFLIFLNASVIGSMSRYLYVDLVKEKRGWEIGNPMIQVIRGIVLSFGFYLFIEFTNISLNSSLIKIASLADVQRIGISFSLTLFVASLFLEKAFDRFSDLSDGHINKIQ